MRWAEALATPSRVSLVRALLRNDGSTVLELAAKAGISEANARHHLGHLIALDLAERTSDGYRFHYALTDPAAARRALEDHDTPERRRVTRRERDVMRAIGAALRRRREAHQIPVDEMASRLSTTARHLRQIEMGQEDARLLLLLRYAETFDPSWLDVASAAARLVR